MAKADGKPGRAAAAADPLDIRIRAAWLYYIEGLTQEQVAQHLGISRIKALRLLAASREEGLVQISINAKAARQVALERELRHHLKLEDVTVVPAAQNGENTFRVVGHAAGHYLSEQMRDGLKVGIGWGATLQASLNSIAWRDVERCSFVSLLGGLTHATALNPSAVAWRLADFYKAEFYQITAPVYVDDPGLARLLWAQPVLGQLRSHAQKLDLAMVSVGGMSPDATIFREDMLSWEADGRALKAAGAVGDILCQFLDAQGRILDHSANRRAMAVGLDELTSARVVIASGGADKAAAIRAGAAAIHAKVLVTDETAAEALLELPPL